MASLEDHREILGFTKEELSDEKLEVFREYARDMAKFLLDSYVDHMKKKNGLDKEINQP